MAIQGIPLAVGSVRTSRNLHGRLTSLVARVASARVALLVFAGLFSSSNLAQGIRTENAAGASPSRNEISAGNATLLRFDPRTGELRQVDLRGQSAASSAAPPTPERDAVQAGSIARREIYIAGTAPKGSTYSMGSPKAIDKVLSPLQRGSILIPCQSGMPRQVGNTANVTGVDWCPPEGNANAVPQARRLNEYASRCEIAVTTVASSMGRSRDFGFTPVDEQIKNRYLECSAPIKNLPESHRKWVETRVFIIGITVASAAGAVLPCTGLALQADLIVTARHCFFPTANGKRIDGISAGSVRVYAITRPGASFAVKELLDVDGNPLFSPSAGAHRKPSDVAFIRLSSAVDLGDSVDVRIVGIPPDSGKVVAGLVIPGFHNELTSNAGSVIPQGGGEFVRYDNSGGCAIVRFENASCYAHTCQTGPGVSGAPVLRLEDVDGRLRAYLLGIHIAADDVTKACGARLPADKMTAFYWSEAAVNLAEFPVGRLFEQ